MSTVTRPNPTIVAIFARGRKLLNEYGVEGWTIKMSNNIGPNVALTSYQRKTLFISKKYASVLTRSEIEFVLRHELAHILVGPGHGHGRVWQSKARQLGINLDEGLYSSREPATA